MARRWDLFKEFFQSEKAAGFILIGCTIVSLVIANTALGPAYRQVIHNYLDLSFANVELKYSVEHWINDGLMAIFFLLVGLEIERELYVGELSSIRNALLPIVAAIGGMFLPAIVHFSLNSGTNTQSGFGIPMATDIAFALGILSLAGNRVPTSLKIFLTALAIMDDLGAITVIALFYTKEFSSAYFFTAIGIFVVLFVMGKMKVRHLVVYLIPGVIMWYCMLKSGVHATIAGVLLAFAIPFHPDDNVNPSYKLQHFLHNPVAFLILPLFALANTAITIPSDPMAALSTRNSLGIILGLLLGKFVGITLFCYLAVKTGITKLTAEISWRQLMGVALLAGIGFTMSIFISNLAFTNPVIITESKLSILLASIVAAVAGLILLLKQPSTLSKNRGKESILPVND
ncbi:MAG TPA: Na+/H+ antiporter NhaA [Chitinophagaceae bacterium]|nr:Na+/H+ antiporter NhaA [Chitinophagaceae bacterium]